MPRLETRLNCTRCHEFTKWKGENKRTVKCEDCGKRHSTDSLRPVNPDKEYSRDEEGNLTEMPP